MKKEIEVDKELEEISKREYNKSFGDLTEEQRDNVIIKAIVEEEKRNVEEDRKMNKEMKAKGYRYRIDYWIHHYSGGDDTLKTAFFMEKPTDEDIEELLKDSAIKNDFKITKL